MYLVKFLNLIRNLVSTSSIVNTVFKSKDRWWELIYWNWAYYSIIINWSKLELALGHASVMPNHISSSNPLYKCHQRVHSNSWGLTALSETVLHQGNLTFCSSWNWGTLIYTVVNLYKSILMYHIYEAPSRPKGGLDKSSWGRILKHSM